MILKLLDCHIDLRKIVYIKELTFGYAIHFDNSFVEVRCKESEINTFIKFWEKAKLAP